jgi:hypothetical protein
MTEIFQGYWWLLFPLGFFIAAGWGSFMRYKRTQAKIDLLKAYAASGKEPPADLIASLDGDQDEDHEHDGGRGHRSGGGQVFLVFLFAGLSAVFAYAGWSGMLGEDQQSLYFVAMILGVLSLAFLASGIGSLFNRRDR